MLCEVKELNIYDTGARYSYRTSGVNVHQVYRLSCENHIFSNLHSMPQGLNAPPLRICGTEEDVEMSGGKAIAR